MLSKKIIKKIYNNFGLGDCSFSNLVWNVEWMLKNFGLTIRNNPQGLLTIFKYVVTFATQFYSYQVGCLLYYIYVVIPSGKSILQNIELGMVYNISVLNIGRLLWFHMRRTNIAEMISLGFELDNDISHNERWKEAIITRMRLVKIGCIVLWLTWTISTFEHLVKPAFLAERELPDIYVVYPGLVPVTLAPNYQIGYTLQVLSTYTMLMIAMGYLTLFIAISGHATSHMHALADQLHLLNEDFKKSNIIKKNFDKKLKIIIATHNKVKKFGKKSADTFNEIIGFDFFILGCLLCALMLQSQSWLYIVRYLPNFSLPVIMITLYCVLGQHVIDASEQFENVVHNFNWDDLDVKTRKIFFMIAMNSQDPLVFKFLFVLPLAHKMEMSIIKIVYSAYTALNSARNYNY